MSDWISKYKMHLKDRNFLIAAFTALVLLVVSLVINNYAGIYATERASNSVTDIVLSNIRVYDVDFIFNYGAIIFWVFMIFLFMVQPGRIPFTLKSIALFVVVRSVFISLTHIGPFPIPADFDPAGILGKFTFGGDLFFSGHTGLPYLMALVFWDEKWLRILFIACSILFGVVVLLAHIHYSIDVLGAFFITYTIYHIASKIFRKDMIYFSKSV